MLRGSHFHCRGNPASNSSKPGFGTRFEVDGQVVTVVGRTVVEVILSVARITGGFDSEAAVEEGAVEDVIDSQAYHISVFDFVNGNVFPR